MTCKSAFVWSVVCFACCFGKDNCSFEYDNIATDLDFKKICYDLSWRAHASCYVNTTNADNWHHRDKYKTSIYVEMTRAIVDCKLNLGAFNPA